MGTKSEILFPVIITVPSSRRWPRGKERVQYLSRLARQAVLASAQESDLKISTFPKNKDGAPVPLNGIYWSVTHKPDYVGGVVATGPVGIDIEKIRPVKDGVMEKIAGKDEWALAGGKTPEMFFRFWTAKEAVLKVMGVGFTGLSHCRIVHIEDEDRLIAAYGPSRFTVHQTRFAADHIAAITGTTGSVQWVFIEDSARLE